MTEALSKFKKEMAKVQEEFDVDEEDAVKQHQ